LAPQRSGEPEAAGLSIWYEELWHRSKVGHNVPEVQKHFIGSGEGLAAVWTGFRGECGTPRQVIKTDNLRTLISSLWL